MECFAAVVNVRSVLVLVDCPFGDDCSSADMEMVLS